MIAYEEDSLWTLLFRLNGSVFPRAAFFAVPAACVCFCLVLMERWIPGYREETVLAALNGGAVWSMTTAVLIYMVGFRTSRAMARFWEGTGLLHQMKGEWFDTVSNCVTFTICTSSEKKAEVDRFRHTIVRLMSLCHGSALEEISGMGGMMETIDVCGLSTKTLKHLKDCVETHNFNKVEVLLHLLQSLITDAHQKEIIRIPPPILSRVYQTISRGYVNLLNTKKITDTKFPFPYAQLIVVLLFLHSILTPIIVSVTVDSLVIAPILAFIPVFGSHALNFISIQLEDPFGADDNDLPLSHFQAEMNNCLLMLLHPRTDIIADVSDGCIMDFALLKEGVLLDHCSAPRDSGHDFTEAKARRSSVKLFDPSFHVSGTRSSLEAMSPPEISQSAHLNLDVEGEGSAGDGLEAVSSDEFATLDGDVCDEGLCTGDPTGDVPNLLTVARSLEHVVAIDGLLGASVPVVANHGEQFRAATAAGWKDVPAAALRGRSASSREFESAVLGSLEELNVSLRSWTDTMERQVHELVLRFTALQELEGRWIGCGSEMLM
mmetsp:Transcript_21914/g.62916  ORF Transcript_21914/g.62916 Transcript_21914/m.62916 type:complete len:548 (+) Transcript_21914:71-1714(+)